MGKFIEGTAGRPLKKKIREGRGRIFDLEGKKWAGVAGLERQKKENPGGEEWPSSLKGQRKDPNLQGLRDRAALARLLFTSRRKQ